MCSFTSRPCRLPEFKPFVTARKSPSIPNRIGWVRARKPSISNCYRTTVGSHRPAPCREHRLCYWTHLLEWRFQQGARHSDAASA